MKISDRLAAEMLTRRVATGRAAMDRAAAQITSGRRVNAPSDDPAAYALALRLKDAQKRSAEHQAGIERGAGMIDAAAGALSSAHDLVSRARELAISGGSASATPEAREAAAKEIDGIRAEMARLRATQANGEPVFMSGGRERRIEVGPGATSATTLPAETSFGDDVGLDTALENLSNDLRAGRSASARGQVDGLALGLRRIEGGIAAAGAARASLDIAKKVAEKADAMMQTQMNGAIAADPIRAMADLTAQETALRASLEVGTRLMRPILADKI